MTQDIIDAIRRILAGGYKVHKVGKIWRIGSSGDTVSGSTVGRMIRAGFLTGNRRGGVATVTHAGQRAVATARMPAIGTEIAFRVTGYRGGQKAPRYIHGRVIAHFMSGFAAHHFAAAYGHACPSVLAVVRDVDGTVSLWEPSRPNAASHWKASARSTLGYFAPKQGHRHSPALWAALCAIPGLVPAIWHAVPEGDPFSLARLRWVRARLNSIGAYPQTPEEHASTWHDHLDRMRRQLAHEADAGRAEYLREFIARNAALVREAEVVALTEQVAHVVWWQISKPKLDAKYAAKRDAIRSRVAGQTIAEDPDSERSIDATYAEVVAAMTDEIRRGAVDVALLPEAIAQNQARIDSRRAARARGESPDRK